MDEDGGAGAQHGDMHHHDLFPVEFLNTLNPQGIPTHQVLLN